MAKIREGVAYYPLTFYFGLALLVGLGAVAYFRFAYSWEFNWLQLKYWINNHVTDIVLVFGILLAITLIGSAMAYRKLVSLPKEEYWLWLNQRATRTLFPWMMPLHDWLRLRVKIYRWWHAHTFSSALHLVLLVAVGLMMANVVRGSVTTVLAGPPSEGGCSDTVNITVNTTWSTNQCHGDVTVSNGATLTINGGITADLGTLTLGVVSPASNGFITAKGDTLNGVGVTIEVTGDVDIKSGSSISGDGQGYTGGTTGGGNGNGPGGGTGSATAHGGGGGHGAVGGAQTGGSDGAGGTAYGTYNGPVALGSGGGGANGAGTNGASAIKIDAPNSTVTISGTISFNGNTTTCGAGATAPGGGAGGSVWIIANTLAGSGTVRANGGRCTTYTDTPGGAGGRIFISATNDSSSLTKQAFGGSGASSTTHRGGAGTILHNNALAVVNDSVISTNISPSTPFTGSSYSFTSTTVSYAATVELGSSTSFSGGDLTINNGTDTFIIPQNISSEPTFSSINIASGGTLRHPANSNTHSYSLILASTGAVTVTGNVTLDGLGYTGGGVNTAGNGPGGGLGSGTGCGGSGAHAGYGQGGVGVCGSGGANGGSPYGTESAPTTPGSGGGGGSGSGGGAGGGVLKINAPTATVTVSGTISSNGSAGGGASGSGGGGAGGSIWIRSSTFTGTGTLRANAGGSCGFACTSGSGGMIRVEASSDTSSLTALQAEGGQGSTNHGAAGIAWRASYLQIANNSANAVLSPITPISETSYTLTSSLINYRANVELGSSTTINTGATTIQNSSKVSLASVNTVWTGTTLTVQTGTNTINVSPSVVAEPTFSGDITIGSGTLTHDANSTTDNYHVILNSGEDITVTGTVSLDGKGYTGGAAGANNGNGPGGGVGSGTGCGGSGGHAGNGQSATGICGSGGSNGGTGNYGLASAPVTLGSGGGGGSGGSGGAGGGAIKLSAQSGTVTVNGTITATGGAGSGSNSGGGGAGGSIWIRSSTFAGTGTIGAKGSSACSFTCTSGSGGRIRIENTTDTSTLVSFQAEGGQGSSHHGAVGTAWKGTTMQLTNNSGNVATSPPSTALTESSYSFTTTTLNYRANIEIGASTTFGAGAMTIQNNSRLALLGNNSVLSGTTLTFATGTNYFSVPPTVSTKPYFSGNISISNTLVHIDNDNTHDYSLILKSGGNITVESGAIIDLNGLGYWGGWLSTAGSGPGGGATAASSGGGGGHGGAGGNASSGALGGAANGDAVNPTSLGSGGGGDSDAFAGDGGGAVELAAAGTLTVTGTVRANAFNSGGNGSGGGAGGSVKLVGGTIAGNGTIQATGGNGVSGGGCGGGGRIARHYNSSTFSGSVSVAKGTGNGTCGDGTNQLVTAVTNFLVSGHNSPTTAGTQGSFSVTPRDTSNNQNQAFTGTVSFSSSDAQATLPANYTFTIQDGGTKSFNATLKTAGTQSLTSTQVGSPSVTGSQSGIVVNPASATLLTVTGVDDPITAGTADTVTVTAKDAYNNTATGYTGTVTFTSNDAAATLPSNYAFVGGDAGVKSFTNGVVLKTAGERTVTATDTVTSSVNGTQANITVNPAVVSTLNFTGINTPTTAGVTHSPAVTAKDAYSNTVTSYTGTLAFSSTDPLSTLPTNYTFTGSDNGTKTFTDGVAFKTAGTQTVTITDGTLTSEITNISVAAGLPSKLKVSDVTSPIQAGTPTSAKVTVQDSFNNTVTGYTGTVGFSSSDTAATLPANYTFTGTEQGIKTFTNGVTFNTAGTQTVTATDTTDAAVTGTLAGITVTAAPTTNPGGQTGGQGNSQGNSQGNNQGGNQQSTISVILIIINPETGTFTGTISQEVGGQQLTLELTGTLAGSTITGLAEGSYGALPVTGTITGTVKNSKITSAQLALFSSQNSDFSLSVLLVGDIQSSTIPVTKDTGKCVMEGNLTTTINGKQFVGTVKFSIEEDGSLKGTLSGQLDGRRVVGRFTAQSYETELIGGEVTLRRQDGDKTPITGELVGQIDSGEIKLTSARNCSLKGKVSFVTDAPGNSTGSNHGNSNVVIPDEPDQGTETPIDAPFEGTITDPEDSKTDIIVLGTVQSTLGDIVVQPNDMTSYPIYLRDLVSGSVTLVSVVSTIPVLPSVRVELITSSVRNFGFFRWFFAGYLPRRRRKFWGVIRDGATSAPVANVMVKLENVTTGQTVKSYRTDRSGRYGFLVEQAGQYAVSISDPLYRGYLSHPISISDPVNQVVSKDIELVAHEQKAKQAFKRAQLWLTVMIIFNYLHWPTLILGTILSLYAIYLDPNTLQTLLAIFYLLIWLAKILGMRRERHYGQVVDESDRPLARTIVQLTSKSDDVTNHIQSTITDKYGRFVILVNPGVYDLIVAKEGFAPRHGAIIADQTNMKIKLTRLVN